MEVRGDERHGLGLHQTVSVDEVRRDCNVDARADQQSQKFLQHHKQQAVGLGDAGSAAKSGWPDRTGSSIALTDSRGTDQTNRPMTCEFGSRKGYPRLSSFILVERK